MLRAEPADPRSAGAWHFGQLVYTGESLTNVIDRSHPVRPGPSSRADGFKLARKASPGRCRSMPSKKTGDLGSNGARRGDDPIRMHVVRGRRPTSFASRLVLASLLLLPTALHAAVPLIDVPRGTVAQAAHSLGLQGGEHRHPRCRARAPARARASWTHECGPGDRPTGALGRVAVEAVGPRRSSLPPPRRGRSRFGLSDSRGPLGHRSCPPSTRPRPRSSSPRPSATRRSATSPDSGAGSRAASCAAGGRSDRTLSRRGRRIFVDPPRRRAQQTVHPRNRRFQLQRPDPVAGRPYVGDLRRRLQRTRSRSSAEIDMDDIRNNRGSARDIVRRGCLAKSSCSTRERRSLEGASGTMTVGASTTQHGALGYDASAVLNAPLRGDSAVRAVPYRVVDGGLHRQSCHQQE